jgi:hypothetical protein
MSTCNRRLEELNSSTQHANSFFFPFTNSPNNQHYGSRVMFFFHPIDACKVFECGFGVYHLHRIIRSNPME